MTTTASQARDVQIFPIAADTTAIRARSWNRLRFEIEYALERGTTANSYLIQGDKTALIDVPGESFTEIFIHQLSPQEKAEGLPLWSDLWAQLRWVTQGYTGSDRLTADLKSLDYLVLGHINKNRAATLTALLDLAPQITIICSNPAALLLPELLPDRDLDIRVIKSDETLDLGKGHQLTFIPTPTPRWPDELCTYDAGSKILYTDKFFGAHRCGDQVFDEDWDELIEDRRYYFDCLMAPNARQVESALDKFADLETRGYAPGHGPLVRYGFMELTKQYRHWSQQQKTREQRVALIYASAYGNTATIAQALARGVTKAGVAVESINAEHADPDDIKAAVEKSAGFLMGSPTLGGHAPTQMQTALGIVLSNASKTQLAGVFGSFGWSGEAIDLLENKLKDGGYSLGFEPIRVKFKPDDTTIKYCEEVGTDFAQSLKKAKRAKAPRTPATSVEQAVGRLVGSLSVVTAKQGDVSSAMLASWVSQATFTPPGLTVAVAKDRAIESLLYPGSPFVLNILAEGKYIKPMKHFLKPFGPGEDRFEGIETDTNEAGIPVLKEAIAYLECEVSKRMECGDHWLVYALVKAGELQDADAKTAVHHRKSGTHY
ncbi:flavin oxidoreductase [filamentous cyanobacterium CCP5]|nr:flavin oxidoreductase [filamentous cyanobacterium CCP5]